MARQSIIITDVTEMRVGVTYCVAGWNSQANRMIRPLPGVGNNWPNTHIGPALIWPGNEFHFDESALKNNGTFPHTSEDLVISTQNMQIATNMNRDWNPLVQPSTSASLSAAFGNAVTWRVYNQERYHTVVPAGTNVASLGAITIQSTDIDFFVDDFDSIRCRLSDSDATYKLPLVAHNLRIIWRQQGIEALQTTFSNAGLLYVRLGLARPYDAHPDECTVMVNGIYYV